MIQTGEFGLPFLADDTSEQAEADRQVVGAWEGAHDTPDIKGAADEARARLLNMHPKDVR